MEIRITGLDYQVTPEDRSYLEERLVAIDRILGRDAQRAEYSAELGKVDSHAHSGSIWKATIAVTYGKEYSFVESTGQSIREAIDTTKDELMSNLRKQRSLHRLLLRKGSRMIKNLVHRE